MVYKTKMTFWENLRRRGGGVLDQVMARITRRVQTGSDDDLPYLRDLLDHIAVVRISGSQISHCTPDTHDNNAKAQLEPCVLYGLLDNLKHYDPEHPQKGPLFYNVSFSDTMVNGNHHLDVGFGWRSGTHSETYRICSIHVDGVEKAQEMLDLENMAATPAYAAPA